MRDDSSQAELPTTRETAAVAAPAAATGRLDDYCAACGVRAPDLVEATPTDILAKLRELGWLIVPTRALHQEVWPRVARNALCADCLAAPSPFVRSLLRAWGAGRAASLRLPS